MLITIALCAIALWVGWMAGSARSRERIAVAEARVADMHRMESAFAATAQRVFSELGTTIVQQNSVQVGGALDTKKAEIATLLDPLSRMLDEYRGELAKSERLRNQVYGGLEQQIKTLLTTQQSAQREAARL